MTFYCVVNVVDKFIVHYKLCHYSEYAPMGSPEHHLHQDHCLHPHLTFTRYGQEEAENLKKVGRGKRKGRNGRWRGRGSGQKA